VFKQYKLGKYDIVAQPAAGATHMLRYSVFVAGKRVGALLSVPTESDCRFLEAPPEVPAAQGRAARRQRSRKRPDDPLDDQGPALLEKGTSRPRGLSLSSRFASRRPENA
jgi:hypothetical protein